MAKDTIKKLTKVEFSINKNLFRITTAVTVLAMFMLSVEFFTRGSFPSAKGVTLFYIGVLFLYSFHKEALRWIQKKGDERQGEKFVYAWIGMVIILYFINFLSGCRFTFSPEGAEYATLDKITITALEVFVIFVITRVSKMLKIKSFKNRN